MSKIITIWPNIKLSYPKFLEILDHWFTICLLIINIKSLILDEN